MGINHQGPIIRDGLVLCLDAANPKSYPESGTTWYDLSGNGNNGTLVNGPTYNSGNNGSIVFDGVNDFVELGNPSSLNITQEITNFLWLYPISNYANGYNGILTKANSGSTAGSLSHTLIYINSAKNYVTQYGKSDGSAGNAAVDPDVVIFNKWVCYCSTYNGTSVKLFKNGMLVNEVSQTGLIYNINQNTGVKLGRDGRYNFDSGRQYNGNISQVSIYNRALSPSEIQQNFQATRGRYGI